MDEYIVKTSIKNWAEDDKPREKLLLKGRSALSDSELLAILIGSGNRKESAVDLTKRILNDVDDNLIELTKLSVSDLMKYNGIGEAKAISIVAALELGKRRRSSEVLNKKRITTSREVFEAFQDVLSDSQYEEFWMLLLNRANKILKKVCISEGGVSGTVADPKKIFKIALENNAVSIILCHNHPSGNIEPSHADIKLTKKLKEAGANLEMPVLDHIIIGDEKYYSFADEGIL
ncbi:MAG: DNA repair protein RadC [Saprospiraceae bacterium]|nr:DNA repair protein RadC [Saprospiraceae bacterium]